MMAKMNDDKPILNIDYDVLKEAKSLFKMIMYDDSVPTDAAAIKLVAITLQKYRDAAEDLALELKTIILMAKSGKVPNGDVIEGMEHTLKKYEKVKRV